MQIGPLPMAHEERLALARSIAARAQEVHGDNLLAAGAYGSLARGEDGPYSDVESSASCNSPRSTRRPSGPPAHGRQR